MSLYEGWTVVCDAPPKGGRTCCAMDRASGTKGSAKVDFRRKGWVFVRGHSFCPDCARNLKVSK